MDLMWSYKSGQEVFLIWQLFHFLGWSNNHSYICYCMEIFRFKTSSESRWWQKIEHVSAKKIDLLSSWERKFFCMLHSSHVIVEFLCFRFLFPPSLMYASISVKSFIWFFNSFQNGGLGKLNEMKIVYKTWNRPFVLHLKNKKQITSIFAKS